MSIRLHRLLAGFRYLTLDPSRLRELRHKAQARPRPAPLPPLPDSACPPGAVPLGTSAIPDTMDIVIPSVPGAIGYAIMGAPLPGMEPSRHGYLLCAECSTLLDRDPLCSDLAVLTLHWMSEHRDKYVAMHPQTEPYLPG